MNYNILQHRDQEPFDAILNGSKKMEIRLYDKKIQKIKLGWIIKGVLRNDDSKYFYSKVIGLSRFKSFEDLYKVLGDRINTYEKELLVKVYSKEKEEKYGVLVIHFELLKQR